MESTGQALKKLRLEKGLSIEEVHKKTKIHLNILKAIEEDGVVNLSPIYIKGFIKLYCQALGADPKEYISDYKEPQIARLAKPGSSEPRANGPSLFDTVLAKLKSFKGIHVDQRVKKGLIIGLCALVGLFILVKVGKAITHKIATMPKKERVAAGSHQSERTQKEKVKNQAKQTEKVKPSEAIAIKPSISGPRLGIIAHSDCWVTLKSDGRLIFHSTLKKGQSENWQAKDKIEVSLSDAGAVDVVVNGERIAALGKKGRARKNIVITKNGLNLP